MPSSEGIFRASASIRRSIEDGISSLVNQGMDMMGMGGRRSLNQPHDFGFQPALGIPIQYPVGFSPPAIQHDWAFLSLFEQEYGTLHPFFYVCPFADVMRIAEEEKKLLFMYIHSPEHPFSRTFSRDALCSEIVVEYLDANFVSWGGLASRGECSVLAAALKVCHFPFCAVVSPSPSDDLAVIRKIEGPVSADELIEILQTTIDDQGQQLGAENAEQEENRRLREEQNAAFLEALRIDQDKETNENTSHLADEVPNGKPTNAQTDNLKSVGTCSTDPSLEATKTDEVTQILIRFPNGERREHCFSSSDEVREIYRFIDSQGHPGVANCRLVSTFPRKVYGDAQMGISLKEAGLHPKASVFLEIT